MKRMTTWPLQWGFPSLSSTSGDGYQTKCRLWTDRRTSVRVPTYKSAGDGGPLPSDAWDAPDQDVLLEGEGDPDSV
jgi:hypothetical protein